MENAIMAASSPLFLIASSIVLLIVGSIKSLKWLSGYAALIAASVALFFLRQPPSDIAIFGGMAIITGKALWIWKIILAALAGSAFISISFPLQHPGIYYFLLFISAAGGMFTVAADNLFFAFIASETMAMPLYFLVACRRGKQGLYAAYKFSVSGMFLASFTMLGLAFMGYSCSSISLKALSEYGLPDGLALMGFILFSAGFSFKMLAIPFNLVFRDVFADAPAAVSAYMAATWALAGMPVLYQISSLFYSGAVHDFFAFVAIITVIYGAFAAFYGNDMRKIASGCLCLGTGFSLLSFGGEQSGEIALLYHLPSFAAASAGLFLFSYYFEKKELSIPISGLAGFSEKHPVIAFAAATVLFSAAGLPPFGGFFAKFLILFSLLKEGSFYTSAAGCISLFFACWCCVRIVSAIFFQSATQDSKTESDQKDKNDDDVPLASGFSIVIISIFLTTYGIFSSYFLDKIGTFVK